MMIPACCSKYCGRDYKDERLEWDAATNEVVQEQDRGAPPASRAVCPSCRYPLSYVKGNWLGGEGVCARSDEAFSLSDPHFVCSECGDVVRLDEGPGAYVDEEFDVYYTGTRQRAVEKMKKGKDGQRHTRAIHYGMDAGSNVADKVFSIIQKMGEEIAEEPEDSNDKDWEPEGDAFSAIGAKDVINLTVSAAQVLQQQGTLVEAEAPCTVFGDTHGQLRDLLLMFNVYGWPGSEDERHFVFNGDFVDRGAHQVEVAMLVLSLKVKFPEKIWLVRGNHEDAVVNKKYGFDKDCIRYCDNDEQQGTEVFQSFHNAFNYLPLGCLIGGKILTVHGGLGDGRWDLEELRKVPRPLEHKDISSSERIHNILWSDPVEDDDPKERDTSGLHVSPRGKAAVKFGWNVTIDFCIRNGLSMIIRSHQFKKHGFGFDVMHDNMLVRVFTARDYEAKQQNDGACLNITEEETGVLRVRPQVLRSMAKEESL